MTQMMPSSDGNSAGRLYGWGDKGVCKNGKNGTRFIRLVNAGNLGCEIRYCGR